MEGLLKLKHSVYPNAVVLPDEALVPGSILRRSRDWSAKRVEKFSKSLNADVAGWLADNCNEYWSIALLNEKNEFVYQPTSGGVPVIALQDDRDALLFFMFVGSLV